MTISEENTRQFLRMCKNLKSLRLQKGLTVEGLSARTGVSSKVLEIIESGEFTEEISVGDLFDLCRFYGMTPYQIFEPL